MSNSPMYIFDGIGCEFSILNSKFLIGQALAGYNTLSTVHVGCYIPYLARNNNDWEVGVGYINNYDGKIVVDRTKIIRSSNSDNTVAFNNIKNAQFYIFANEANFNTGFNNVIVQDSDFVVNKIQSTYLVDASAGSINATLPSVNDSDNLIIEFKLISVTDPLYIRTKNGTLFYTLTPSDSYLRLVSDGTRWVGLNNNMVFDIKTLSEDESFGALSNPSGSTLSFQYNLDGTNFAGANLFYGSGNKLLFGNDSEATAHHIIPTSGNSDVVFNSNNTNTNFVIEGSGTRNLFFDYRGRLGLNIPSGSTPDTIVHIINSTCKEGIRLENRSACHPANLTLYYKPSSTITADTIIGKINLAGKNTVGNQVDYARIDAIALDSTAAASKGQLNISVALPDASGTGLTTFKTNADYTYIGYSGNNLTINNSGSTKLGYSNSFVSATSSAVTLQSPTLNFNSTNIVLGTGTSTNVNVPNLYANTIQSNSLRLQNIAASSVLSINSSGQVVAGSAIVLPIPENYFLTTTTNGAITGLYEIDDYFRTNGDVVWNTYDTRPCSVAIRQILFSENIPTSEYVVGDQVEVLIGSTKYYRDIESVEVTNNNITALLLNQNITTSSVVSGTIHSITRGGYLSLSKNVAAGTVSDATSNILSVRPNTDTIFNSDKKDINFNVYGLDEIPALSIKANTGRTTVPSGFYHAFASQKPQCADCITAYGPENDPEPVPMVVNSSGVGLSSAHSSANFDYITSGLFSGIVSAVGSNGLPSYYGTYDQNGNVAEWIEDASVASTSSSQYVAGGSWKTETDNTIGASGLKSIESVVRASGYNYVGFRVASQYSITDNTNISTTLDMDFVSVSNPNNIPDDGTLYLFDNAEYVPMESANLGVVNKNYRIGKHEITNQQYVQFLNAVATTNDRNLFKSSMSSSAIGGITRIGDGSSTPYEYSVKSNMGNKPVVFVDYLSAIRFINWLHNGALLTGITDIDTILDFGAYDIFPIGNSSYLINKNTYQKYWLPSLNEWHKAAYFEPRESVINTGSSSVMIKRENPYVVTTGTTPPILANLSVSGWLYVDHLIVGDNINSSSTIPRRTLPTDTEVSCATNSDCEFCEVCSDNICVASTHVCCVGDCCKPGGWDPITAVCTRCGECDVNNNNNFTDSEIPCELTGTC